MCDDVHIDVLSDYFHCSEVVCCDWYDEYWVVVVVGCLYFGQVVAYGLVFVHWQVGEEYGFLDACTSFVFEVFDDESSCFVGFYVVHYEEEHLSCGSFSVVDGVEYSVDSFVEWWQFAFCVCRLLVWRCVDAVLCHVFEYGDIVDGLFFSWHI